VFGGLVGGFCVLLLFGSFWWSLLCSFLWSFWLSVFGPCLVSWLSLLVLFVFFCMFGGVAAACWWSCRVLLAVFLCPFADLVGSCWLSFGGLFGDVCLFIWLSVWVLLVVLLGPVGGLVWSCWWSCYVRLVVLLGPVLVV